MGSKSLKHHKSYLIDSVFTLIHDVCVFFCSVFLTEIQENYNITFIFTNRFSSFPIYETFIALYNCEILSYLLKDRMQIEDIPVNNIWNLLVPLSQRT